MEAPSAKADERPIVLFLYSDNEAKSIVTRVNNREYEYFFIGSVEPYVRVFCGLLKKGLNGKALNWIKHAATRCEPL